MFKGRYLFLAVALAFAGLLASGLALAQEPEPGTPHSVNEALGTDFTYQGQLERGGETVTDTCEIAFRLYDASEGGAQVGSSIIHTKAITDGFFTAQLNFGSSAFDGQARWLGIRVKCTGDGDFSDLGRQALTPAPYALALPGLWTWQNSTSPNLIGGHSDNSVTAGAYGAAIGGGGWEGFTNHVTDDYGVVGGGAVNQAGDSAGTTSDAHYATVGGGYGNQAQDSYATIGGGRENAVTGMYATVGGGQSNVGTGSSATIAGGQSNETGSSYTAIGGGFNNEASGSYASVGGGGYNTASGVGAVIAGGGGLDFVTPVTNTASGDWSAIGGGGYNVVTSTFGTIGGGGHNVVTSTFASIGGGSGNKAGGEYATVAGGYDNVASAANTTVGGGINNVASRDGATVCGGHDNVANDYNATAGGGKGNVVSGDYATVAGGYDNVASDRSASIGGGLENQATEYYATVPGGRGAVADLYGQMAYASGEFDDLGDAQASLYVLRNETTDDTQTELFLNGSSRRLTIAPGQTIAFDILVVAVDTWGYSAGYRLEGVVERGVYLSPNLLGFSKTVLAEDTVGWDVTLEADAIENALLIKVTGSTDVTVRWVATVRTAEVSW